MGKETFSKGVLSRTIHQDSAGTTSSSRRRLRRRTLILEGLPIEPEPSLRRSSSMPASGSPSKARRMSPSRRPAAKAGPSRLDEDGAERHLAGKAEEAGGVARQGEVLAAEAEVAAAHPALPEDGRRHDGDGVRGYREAESLGLADHRRVHADDAAARVDERASRIAGVEGGVGLDDVVDQPCRRDRGTSGRAR